MKRLARDKHLFPLIFPSMPMAWEVIIDVCSIVGSHRSRNILQMIKVEPAAPVSAFAYNRP